jgi:hypothetical protein
MRKSTSQYLARSDSRSRNAWVVNGIAHPQQVAGAREMIKELRQDCSQGMPPADLAVDCQRVAIQAAIQDCIGRQPSTFDGEADPLPVERVDQPGCIPSKQAAGSGDALPPPVDRQGVSVNGNPGQRDPLAGP